MNLVEGKRTISEIRDVIRLLRSVPLSKMTEYMDLLSKSKAMGQARPMGN
jgi:hypothetical protein